jgi:hypothetical protein
MFMSSNNQLTVYRVRNALRSQIHTQHINAPCGQNLGFFNVTRAIRVRCPENEGHVPVTERK